MSVQAKYVCLGCGVETQRIDVTNYLGNLTLIESLNSFINIQIQHAWHPWHPVFRPRVHQCSERQVGVVIFSGLISIKD